MWVMAGALASSGAAQAQGDMGPHGGTMGADGKVSKEEFMKRAQQRFEAMDFNHDGVIDASDRKQMRQRMHECREMMGGMGMMGGHGMMGQDGEEKAPPPPKP
jgi:hypothetical protein